jgi:hypothetical protein
VFQLPCAAGQPAANLTKTVGAAELAKQHGTNYPHLKILWRVIGSMLFDGDSKLKTREKLKQLGENARKSLYGGSPWQNGFAKSI